MIKGCDGKEDSPGSSSWIRHSDGGCNDTHVDDSISSCVWIYIIDDSFVMLIADDEKDLIESCETQFV